MKQGGTQVQQIGSIHAADASGTAPSARSRRRSARQSTKIGAAVIAAGLFTVGCGGSDDGGATAGGGGGNDDAPAVESVAATVFDHRAQAHEFGALGLDDSVELRAEDLSAYGAPHVLDGTWYFHDEHSVTAVDPRSGETQWTTELTQPEGVTPEEGGRVELTGDVMTVTWRGDVEIDDREIVQRLDVETGETLWVIDEPGAASNGIYGDVVLLSSFPEEGGTVLAAHDVATGDARWTLDGWNLPVEAGDDVVLLESSEDPFGSEQVYAAVDLADGSVMWTADTFGREVVDTATLAESAFASDVFVVGPAAYVTYGPVLAVLDLTTGEEQWAIDHGLEEVEIALPVGDGVLTVGYPAAPTESSSAIAVSMLSADGSVETLWSGGEVGLRGIVELAGTHHVVLSGNNMEATGELVIVGSDGTIATDTAEGASDHEVIGDTVLRLEADGSVSALALPTLAERWNVELTGFDDVRRIDTATESAFSVSDGDVAAVFSSSAAG